MHGQRALEASMSHRQSGAEGQRKGRRWEVMGKRGRLGKPAGKNGGKWGGKGGGFKGKGKGKGTGKGVYGLDLMGTWGGNDSWDSSGGGEWAQESWGNEWKDSGLRSMGAKLGRSISVLSPAPVKTSNKFAALSDSTTTAIEVPMAHIMAKARVDKRLKNKNKLCKYEPIHTECGCCPTTIDFPPGIPPAWQRRQARRNNTTPPHLVPGVAVDADVSGEWDSEAELSDLEPMEGNSDSEEWKMARTGRRGGKAACTPGTVPTSKSCLCERRASHLLCSSDKCRNYNQRDRPLGSTTAGRVSTDDGSPRSTLTTARHRAPPQPKPNHQTEDVPEEFAMLTSKRKLNDQIDHLLEHIPNYLRTDVEVPNSEILHALRRAGELLERKRVMDYWLTEEGQSELLRKAAERNRHPEERGLYPLGYTKESQALLASAGASSNTGDGGWVQVKLCADTGACDTVMPRIECAHIPIVPSLQSIQGLEYEVADGHEIPNLGERQCVMWTDGATEGRRINLQVADVHKALLSLSRCADMGFESRFGRRAGALIDEVTEEVIPLEREGNLYVLRCWLRAKDPEPFPRPEKYTQIRL